MKNKLMALALSSTIIIANSTTVLAANRDEIDSQIKSTREALSNLQSTKSNLNLKNNSVVQELNSATDKMNTLQIELHSVIENKLKNESELQKIEKDLNINMNGLEKKLVEWYMNKYNSMDSMLQSIIKSESISDFIVTNTHLEYLVDDQNVKVGKIKELLIKQQEVLKKIKEDEARIASVKNQLTDEIKKLEDTRNKYNIELESIQTQENDLTKMLQEKEAEARRIDEEIRIAQEQQALKERQEAEAKQQETVNTTQSSTTSSNTSETVNTPTSGGWIAPLNSYRITSRYGYRIDPITSKESNHNGTDLAAPTGTTIKSAKSGKVIISKYSSSYGHYVVVDHGNGLSTLYAHMSARSVSVGQSVSTGQKLGAVGSTGRSTGPHLHLEMRKGGVRMDAETYIKL